MFHSFGQSPPGAGESTIDSIDDSSNATQLNNMSQQTQPSNDYTEEQSRSPPSKAQDTNLWGLLHRKGDAQEEIKLTHRVKDGQRDTYLIGRADECDVKIPGSCLSVSSVHCRIYCDYSQARLRVFLEDCSANGTFIKNMGKISNGERIELKTGDEIFVVKPRKRSSNESDTNASFINQSMLAQVRHVEDLYIIGDQIGSGMSGTVHLCIERSTGQHFAVKIIDTKKFALTPGLSPGDLREEAAMMSLMELLRGGDLFDKIVAKSRYTEEAARKVMKKPENILLVDPGDDEEVKITDFGLAKRTNQEGLKTFCGTPQYFAPEVLLRKHTVAGVGTYGMNADVWSLGVILYILLSGAFPFDEENLYDHLQNAQYSISGPLWDSISDPAKHLVRSMMTLQPEKRLSVREALEHPWITGAPWKDEVASPLSAHSSSSALDELMQNQPPKESKSKTKAKSKSKRRVASGKSSTNHTSKSWMKRQASGSQGILQMMSVRSLKDTGKDVLKVPVPQSQIASMAVAAAYGGSSWGRSQYSLAEVEKSAAPVSAAAAAVAAQTQSGQSLYSLIIKGGSKPSNANTEKKPKPAEGHPVADVLPTAQVHHGSGADLSMKEKMQMAALKTMKKSSIFTNLLNFSADGDLSLAFEGSVDDIAEGHAIAATVAAPAGAAKAASSYNVAPSKTATASQVAKSKTKPAAAAKRQRTSSKTTQGPSQKCTE
eukprot:GSChrysophyteH1.ASY1.ANO1.925.1 assembled CDS